MVEPISNEWEEQGRDGRESISDKNGFSCWLISKLAAAIQAKVRLVESNMSCCVVVGPRVGTVLDSDTAANSTDLLAWLAQAFTHDCCAEKIVNKCSRCGHASFKAINLRRHAGCGQRGATAGNYTAWATCPAGFYCPNFVAADIRKITQLHKYKNTQFHKCLASCVAG